MVLATSSNHWVPRRDKKENGMRPEEGARRRRKEGERKSHDLCVNGVLAKEPMIENVLYHFFQREIDCLREGELKNWWEEKEFVVNLFFKNNR